MIPPEFMAGIVNGLALHGGLIPFGATFFVFSDYLRPSARLAALMSTQSIFVLTHDSIGVGEDGPTHQPVEHLAAMRLIPNLLVLRPADANETADCWMLAIKHKGPSCLVLTRQSLPILPVDRAAMAAKEPTRIPEWIAAIAIAWVLNSAILLASYPISHFLGQKVMIAITRLMGMPFSGSKYGVLAGGLGGKLNDKIYFKDVARELDIPVIEYCTANDASGVKAAIHKVSAENKDRVILKKPCNAGGYGNLAGTEAELLARLPQWYDGGDLIIEHHKTLLETAGSLALLEDDRTDFIGADLQFVENNAWRGCVFPNSSKAYAAQVQKHTMGPSTASTRSSTPSTICSTRSTSLPKSACPGVSTIFIVWSL